MPPADRRVLLRGATECEPVKDTAPRYDVVAIDANAMLRWLLGARNNERISPRTSAQMFIRAFVAPYAHEGTTIIVAYDDPKRAPAARQALHARRYRRLPAQPVTMNRRTHVFVDGRVYRIADAPAKPEVVAASTVAAVGATMAQMFNSPAGKTRYFELHCTAVLAELQYALRKDEFAGTAFVISPPTGDTDIRLEGKACTHTEKPSNYGEADMIVPVQAKRHGGPDATRLVITIDTDSLVQCLMLGLVNTKIHLATVYVHDASIYTRQNKAPSGAVRSREIISVDAARRTLSFSAAAMILVFGCDYTSGCFVRQLGISKKGLSQAIAAAPTFLEVTDTAIVVDWPRFFAALGAAQARVPSAPMDVEMVDREARHLAYCWTYYAGFQSQLGGPAIDDRAVLDAEVDRQALLAGQGCRPLAYPAPSPPASA